MAETEGMALFTAVNLLQNRTSRNSDRIAYIFREDGEKLTPSLTYRTLRRKS